MVDLPERKSEIQLSWPLSIRQELVDDKSILYAQLKISPPNSSSVRL